MKERTPVLKWRKGRHSSRRFTTEWLQDPNMKNIMNACIFWKIESVGHRPNAFEHLIRSSIARTELVTPTRNERLGGTMQQPKQHPISHRELQWPMLGIIVASSVFLCLKQSGSHLL